MVLTFSDLITYTMITFGVLAAVWAFADQLSQLISYIVWRANQTGGKT